MCSATAYLLGRPLFLHECLVGPPKLLLPLTNAHSRTLTGLDTDGVWVLLT